MARRETAVALVCLLAAGPLSFTSAFTVSGGGVCIGSNTSGAAAGPAVRPAARPVDGERDPRPLGEGQAAQMLRDLTSRLAGKIITTKSDITVPTWVHVLSDGEREPPEQAVRNQVDTLNAAYSGRLGGVDTGVHFRLDGITLSKDAAWFSDPLAHEQEMKAALRRGGPETLNLYIGQLDNRILGYSTYPYWYETASKSDGVVVDWRSLPGGALRNFDKGYTAVHEIGHWLGLFHTFENGCAGPGDGVGDTPSEDRPTGNCPMIKNTCTAPGDDPIHNFMDYAHDRCMSDFTAGQAIRMHEMWTAYRDPGRRMK